MNNISRHLLFKFLDCYGITDIHVVYVSLSSIAATDEPASPFFDNCIFIYFLINDNVPDEIEVISTKTDRCAPHRKTRR